jgi:hypothetical protein
MPGVLNRITAPTTINRDISELQSQPDAAAYLGDVVSGVPMQRQIGADLTGPFAGQPNAPANFRGNLPMMTNLPQAPQLVRRTLTTQGPSRLQNFGQDFAMGMSGGPEGTMRSQLIRQQLQQGELDKQEQRSLTASNLTERTFGNAVQTAQLAEQHQRSLSAERRDTLRFEMEMLKFNVDLMKASHTIGLDLSKPHEVAAASVLSQMGVDPSDQRAVQAALAKPGTLEAIGSAARKLDPKADTNSLAERLASAFVDPNKDPKGFANKALEIERQLRTASRDSQADEISQRAALNAEATMLQQERGQLNTNLRSTQTNMQYARSGEKVAMQQQADQIQKRIADINSRLSGIVDEYRGLASARQSGGRRIAPGEDRVSVIAPDGTPGSLPRSNLKKAIERGYKEVK